MTTMKHMAYGVGRLFPVTPRNRVEGVGLCRTLMQHGIPCTLGKFSKGGDDPAEIVSEYQLASNAMRGVRGGADFYLSVKPPALRFNSDHTAAIVLTALQNGHGIQFDAHGFADTDRTIHLLQGMMHQNRNATGSSGRWQFGLTLPSRWRRSLSDARWIAKNGVRVRLVKGEFRADRALEMDPRKGLLALLDQLIGFVPEVAVATHDSQLAREAVERCRRGGVPVRLELLFGMPTGTMLALAKELAVPVGVYVPYGETLFLYGVRHFLSNPLKLFRADSYETVGSHAVKLRRLLAP